MSVEQLQKFLEAIEDLLPNVTRKRRSKTSDESPPPKFTKNVQTMVRPYRIAKCEELGPFNLLKSLDGNTYIFQRCNQKLVEAPSTCTNESNNSNKNCSVNKDLALKSIENRPCDNTLAREGNVFRSTRASNVQNERPNNEKVNAADVRVDDSTERCKVSVNTLRLKNESMACKMFKMCDERCSKIQKRKDEISQLQIKVNELSKKRIAKRRMKIGDFPELSTSQLETIKSLMTGDDSEIITKKFGYSIYRRDILRLRWDPVEEDQEEENAVRGEEEKRYLDDDVINFYMNLLVERAERRSRHGYPKVYAMNTIFTTKLQKAGYTAVRKWTKNYDIFTYDIILVPVHFEEGHWCMVIINMDEKTIKYYDSLVDESTDVDGILSALENYLKDESEDKRKQELDFSGWSKENVTNHPQQGNFYDCGVFSCMTAEFICRNRPIVFKQENMPYFRQKMVLEICTGKMLL